MSDTYNQKLALCSSAFKRKIPERVPISVKEGGWAVLEYGYSFNEVFKNNTEKGAEVYTKFVKDFDPDGLLTYSSGKAPFTLTEIFGGGHYSLSEEFGIQVAGSICEVMEPDEYDVLINKGFVPFLRDVILPRKYPILKEKNSNEIKQLLLDGNNAHAKLMAGCIETEKAIVAAGYPCLSYGGIFHPMDFTMDFLRDFRGMMTDMRRQPTKIMEAFEPMCEFFKHMCFDKPARPDGHVLMWATHIPTYLSGKQFAKFYWPFFRDEIIYMIEKGHTMVCCLEGEWEQHYDTLQDLPDNQGNLVAQTEDENRKLFKAKLGEKMALANGISNSHLEYSSKEECMDITKKILDEAAPGGGYIFTTSRVMLNKNDAKAENLKAVYDTVRKYGKY